METKEIISLDKKYIMPTYGGKTIAFSHGKGCRLWDIEGGEYLDFLSGIAVNGLGHSHPELIKAIKEQLDKLIHTSNLYLIPNQIELAQLLIENSFPGKCFFCNSGAEAIETSIKLARRYGEGRYEIITMTGSFHGRTLGALSATAQEKYHKGFKPLMPGFKYAEFNNLNAIKANLTPKTCAIIVEPLQGEGGINVANEKFMLELRSLCDENGILFIVDEVQCGMGRTGKLFAYEHYGITPDVVTLAKFLGGGLPIGAVIFKESTSSYFQAGDHASTFGGNPLVTKSALTTLKIILKDNLTANAYQMGNYFKESLKKMKETYGFIKEVRGKGLMLGVEVDTLAKEIVKKSMEKGLLIGTSGENVIRFLPPLIIKKEEIDEGLGILEEVFKTIK